MNKLEEAIIYATVMHQGKVRKLVNTPFILHPLEVAQILSMMTSDEDIITAGILVWAGNALGASPEQN